jgi:hypothetical protein
LRGWLEERLAPLAVLEIDLGERRTIFAKTGLALLADLDKRIWQRSLSINQMRRAAVGLGAPASCRHPIR